MPTTFPCPYLNAEVELTDEREAYITRKHSEFLPLLRERLAEALALPERISRSLSAEDTRLFIRWYDDLRGGKYAVVAVVSNAEAGRHWIVTAYVSRKLPKGTVEWEPS